MFVYKQSIYYTYFVPSFVFNSYSSSPAVPSEYPAGSVPFCLNTLNWLGFKTVFQP